MLRKAKSNPKPQEAVVDSHQLMTDKDVKALTGLNRRQRLALEKERRFPRPIRLNQKLMLYRRAAVIEWIEARATEVQ